MTSTTSHKCAICGVEDEHVVFWLGMYVHHIEENGCVVALQRKNAELRSLLDTACDAWECSLAEHGNRIGGLSLDWYTRARKLMEVLDDQSP